eukprot:CAMPEP_0172422158 /NCGR_PEP_ID=MMETSP1064-20121228/8358_1 /TAXON_ID=202472 /ORGANISM="Aulacoseira subarctica , Strain CCAP 1002/5" /LENGTH=209 /DNA_ID=CAMNT_0013162905 /DNA_START=56 /DNA_END=685 /DNA_ORIENTATION=-
MTTAINTAPIKWAQRSDSLYLTIALPDVTDETINLKDEELTFSGKSNGKQYERNIVFLKSVNAAESTYKVLPRSIQMHIMKNSDEENEEFWPRLLKDKSLEKNQVSIDWDRYVEEDEDEGEGFDLSNLQGGQNFGAGGMPGMGGMGGMGGLGGMGGMGGMPGMEGMDLGNMEEFMKKMGGMNMPNEEGEPADSDDEDEDLEDLPELEED